MSGADLPYKSPGASPLFAFICKTKNKVTPPVQPDYLYSCAPRFNIFWIRACMLHGSVMLVYQDRTKKTFFNNLEPEFFEVVFLLILTVPLFIIVLVPVYELAFWNIFLCPSKGTAPRAVIVMTSFWCFPRGLFDTKGYINVSLFACAI